MSKKGPGAISEDDFPTVEIDANKIEEIKGRKFGVGSAIAHEYKQAEAAFAEKVDAYKEAMAPKIAQAEERRDAMMVVKIAKQKELSAIEARVTQQQRTIDENATKIKQMQEAVDKAKAAAQSQLRQADAASVAPPMPSSDGGAPATSAPQPPPPPPMPSSGGGASATSAPPPPPMPPAPGKKAAGGLKIAKKNPASGPSKTKSDSDAEARAAAMAAISKGVKLKSGADRKEPERAAPAGDARDALMKDIQGLRSGLRSAKAPREVAAKKEKAPEDLDGQIAELEEHARQTEQSRYRDLRTLHRQLEKADSDFENAKDFLLTVDEQIIAKTAEVEAQAALMERQATHMQQLRDMQSVYEQQAALYQELQQARVTKPLPEPAEPVEEVKVDQPAASGMTAEPPPPPPPAPSSASSAPPPPPAAGPPPPPMPSGKPQAPKGGRADLFSAIQQGTTLKKAEVNKSDAKADAPPPKKGPMTMAEILAGSSKFQDTQRQQKEEEKREAEAARQRAEEEARREAQILADRTAFAEKELRGATVSDEYKQQADATVAQIKDTTQALEGQSFENMDPALAEAKATMEAIREQIAAAQLEQEADYQARLEAREQERLEAASPPEIDEVDLVELTELADEMGAIADQIEADLAEQQRKDALEAARAVADASPSVDANSAATQRGRSKSISDIDAPVTRGRAMSASGMPLPNLPKKAADAPAPVPSDVSGGPSVSGEQPAATLPDAGPSRPPLERQRRQMFTPAMTGVERKGSSIPSVESAASPAPAEPMPTVFVPTPADAAIVESLMGLPPDKINREHVDGFLDMFKRSDDASFRQRIDGIMKVCELDGDQFKEIVKNVKTREENKRDSFFTIKSDSKERHKDNIEKLETIERQSPDRKAAMKNNR